MRALGVVAKSFDAEQLRARVAERHEGRTGERPTTVEHDDRHIVAGNRLGGGEHTGVAPELDR